MFCAFFTAEVLIRFCAFRTYRYCMVDAWFLFDLTLVIFMVLETWVISLIDLASGGTGGGAGILNNFSSLRLLRLLRLTRMARLMRFFPELMTLVKGMVRAMQSVVFILLFMVVVTYVFAIVFTTRFGTIGFFPKDGNSTLPQLFPDLGTSMMTLFLYGVLADNLTYILGEIQTEDLLMMWAFMVFMVISGMTLLNMLIGVLCQVIEDSSREEAEMRQLNELKVCLVEAFTALDESNDGTISEDEWAKIATNKRVQAALLKLGVEESMMEERLRQMQESLFGRRTGPGGQDQDAGDGLSFDEFVEQVIDLRMDTPAGALDVEMLKATTSSEHKTLRRRLMYVESELRKMLGVPKTANLKTLSSMHSMEELVNVVSSKPRVTEFHENWEFPRFLEQSFGPEA
ncbi:Scn10a [Symbiodinium sp. CCMP2456]|nr:Scn10a [Symbiodinium sp. CCMP2456]